jgi:hypothetical protein
MSNYNSPIIVVLRTLRISIFTPFSASSTSDMTGNWGCEDGRTLLLFTGNIMELGDRGAFLNTSMAKSNAEVCGVKATLTAALTFTAAH